MYFFYFFYFLKRLLVVFWLVNTYQYDVTLPFWVIMRSGRRNVMNHIATKGGSYLVVDVRGILLQWLIVQREGRHDHIWISIFFVTSVQEGGCGYALIWHMGGVYPYMETPQRRRFLGWLKCPLPYYSYATFLVQEKCVFSLDPMLKCLTWWWPSWIYSWFNKDEMQYVWDYLCYGKSANHYLEIS